MFKGIKRAVDPLGRIVIPIELRKSLNIQEGTELEIIADDNIIMLRVPVREDKKLDDAITIIEREMKKAKTADENRIMNKVKQAIQKELGVAENE